MQKLEDHNVSFQNLENLELLAQQVVEGFITGLHKSPFHGFSVEFAEHQIYNKGDSVKNIDWKLFARTDKLFVKRFEEETNLRCHIILDSSASMFYPATGVNKFHFSCLSAAAIINLLRRQRDAFGVTLFSEKIDFNTECKSTVTHQKFIYHHLEQKLNSNHHHSNTNIAINLHLIADQIHKRSLVILFSDLFSPKEENNLEIIFDALQHLKYNKHEVIIFNVMENKHEVKFDFSNVPHQFFDIETKESVNINPGMYREIYKNKTENFKKNLIERCGQLKIDLVDAHLEDGYNPILLAWLIKRNKMS